MDENDKKFNREGNEGGGVVYRFSAKRLDIQHCSANGANSWPSMISDLFSI